MNDPSRPPLIDDDMLNRPIELEKVHLAIGQLQENKPLRPGQILP